MNEAIQMIGFLLNACQQKDNQIQNLQSQVNAMQEAVKNRTAAKSANGKDKDIDKSIPAS